MHKFNLLKYIFIIICVAVIFILVKKSSTSTNDTKPVIAITQIAPHPSLDKIRNGIEDRLREFGITDDQIVFQNAQGNQSTALQIAQKFISIKPTVIVPITTPSAQSVYTFSKAAKIPVIFTGVTDPIAAKLVVPYQENPFIAGVSDSVPVKELVIMIKELLPSVKIIGTISSSSEVNSSSTIDRFEKEALKLGITLRRVEVSSTNDVATAAKSMVGKVDAIYMPNDNTVASAIESILATTLKEKIPFFTSDPESVQKGALFCVAYDQYEMGRFTGDIIIKFLENRNQDVLKNFGIQNPKEKVTVINKKVAKDLQIDYLVLAQKTGLTIVNMD